MNRIKYLFFALPLFAIFTFAGCAEKANSTSTAIEQTSIIFYYGEGCPHCQNVEKFLKDNKVSDKISFQKKEIYSNEANSAEMNEKAKICGLQEDTIGVPFLWDGSNCLVGDQKVIEYFKKKI